eukprot:TRINITY_DN22060_c0_g1_i1.p1 TRINITY_DN22060_c0_g1~~TRINITY_DN22060_c0_g1_i1.p1  ORF type:complete len:1147 (-),score=128.38 TRINITY_DN22060_c0_g1_i1:24-3464(-)
MQYIVGFNALNLANYGITSLEGLGAQPELECLLLQNNFITTFEGLGVQPSLRELHLENNAVKSLKGLESQPKLEVVNLAGNPISKYPHYRLMLLLVAGPNILRIDERAVQPHERELAVRLGAEAASAVRSGWLLELRTGSTSESFNWDRRTPSAASTPPRPVSPTKDRPRKQRDHNVLPEVAEPAPPKHSRQPRQVPTTSPPPMSPPERITRGGGSSPQTSRYSSPPPPAAAPPSLTPTRLANQYGASIEERAVQPPLPPQPLQQHPMPAPNYVTTMGNGERHGQKQNGLPPPAPVPSQKDQRVSRVQQVSPTVTSDADYPSNRQSALRSPFSDGIAVPADEPPRVHEHKKRREARSSRADSLSPFGQPSPITVPLIPPPPPPLQQQTPVDQGFVIGQLQSVNQSLQKKLDETRALLAKERERAQMLLRERQRHTDMGPLGISMDEIQSVSALAFAGGIRVTGNILHQQGVGFGMAQLCNAAYVTIDSSNIVVHKHFDRQRVCEVSVPELIECRLEDQRHCIVLRTRTGAIFELICEDGRKRFALYKCIMFKKGDIPTARNGTQNAASHVSTPRAGTPVQPSSLLASLQLGAAPLNFPSLPPPNFGSPSPPPATATAPVTPAPAPLVSNRTTEIPESPAVQPKIVPKQAAPIAKVAPKPAPAKPKAEPPIPAKPAPPKPQASKGTESATSDTESEATGKVVPAKPKPAPKLPPPVLTVPAEASIPKPTTTAAKRSASSSSDTGKDEDTADSDTEPKKPLPAFTIPVTQATSGAASSLQRLKAAILQSQPKAETEKTLARSASAGSTSSLSSASSDTDRSSGSKSSKDSRRARRIHRPVVLPRSSPLLKATAQSDSDKDDDDDDDDNDSVATQPKVEQPAALRITPAAIAALVGKSEAKSKANKSSKSSTDGDDDDNSGPQLSDDTSKASPEKEKPKQIDSAVLAGIKTVASTKSDSDDSDSEKNEANPRQHSTMTLTLGPGGPNAPAQSQPVDPQPPSLTRPESAPTPPLVAPRISTPTPATTNPPPIHPEAPRAVPALIVPQPGPQTPPPVIAPSQQPSYRPPIQTVHAPGTAPHFAPQAYPSPRPAAYPAPASAVASSATAKPRPVTPLHHPPAAAPPTASAVSAAHATGKKSGGSLKSLFGLK